MSNWRRVDEIITYYGKGVTPKYVDDSSIIVLNQRCIRNNKIDYSLAQNIDDNKEYNKEKLLKVGDVLINSTGQGTAGRVAIIEYIPNGKKLITDSHILILRTKSFHESKCLNYALFSIEDLLQTYIDGSTGQGEFDRVRLFNIQVNYPQSSNEQKKIASILSDLDGKIELNSAINDNLEAMAKTIYDYWFVQFDFPDENGKPYKSSGGKMMYNNVLKREIPEGWGVNSLSDFIKSDKSGDWGKEMKEGNYIVEVQCIRGTDINGIMGKGEANCPPRFILEKNNHKLLEPYDLVIEISGGSPTQSTGRMGYITKEVLDRFNKPLICSNFCKAVSLSKTNTFYFIINSWNKLYDNGTLFGFEGKTSGIKNLLFETFVSHYKLVKPSVNLLELFNNKIEILEKKRQLNLKQNQELASLRDWLLPMLMNGQVKIEDKIMENA